jgi:hypothetical protein
MNTVGIAHHRNHALTPMEQLPRAHRRGQAVLLVPGECVREVRLAAAGDRGRWRTRRSTSGIRPARTPSIRRPGIRSSGILSVAN